MDEVSQGVHAVSLHVRSPWPFSGLLVTSTEGMFGGNYWRAQKQGSAEAVSVGRKSNAVASFPILHYNIIMQYLSST